MDKDFKLIPYKVDKKNVDVNEIPQGVRMIQAPDVWDQSEKGKGIVIAIIDTGCDRDHPDLKDRVIGGRNFTSDDNGNPNKFSDYIGHGTHVAGTIAASINGSGVVGVAPEASLLILKALGGKYGSGSYDWIINAINYAVDRNVDIISMSLGGPHNIPELHQAVLNAVEKNILVVCAAGNEGDGRSHTNEYSYPGSYNEVISVGAIDFQKRSAYFTNSNNEVDVVAPGVNVISTYPRGKFTELSGTSMATPHVSGALALLKNISEKEFGRHLSEAELYAQLIKRTVSVGYPKTIEGNGLVSLALPDRISGILSPLCMINTSNIS
ncbi:S8 family peptidase [Chengkuizengella axinellae]|uniref:S8 family peptidase n=1 Tax=Chengkuizengella axinellae TaxID=3064388 RepID=A0ABT9ITP0_9BACL|nr:S8 family peptidase [Chengkuizengella sp. 2205SS18-9]MDP5272705.1 S8 family peptidase [Chengkuizengella sp. 2205SS18-9]